MTITTDLIEEALKQPVRRDGWSRYKVLNPKGKLKGYTRATTIAKALDDGGGLVNWGKRMVALGLAERADILAMVATTAKDDKKALDKLCEQAAEAGGATIRRDLGTALHAALEGSWDDPTTAPAVFRDDVLAVHQALKAAGLSLVDGMAERIVVRDDIEVAGTFDLILTDGRSNYIADIKTGASLLGALAFSIQLAIYANADNLYCQGPADDGSEDTREPMPELDKSRGIIIHVQPSSGVCDLHWIDLELGAKALDLALEVRTMRKSKPLSAIDVVDSTPLIEDLTAAIEDTFVAKVEEAFPGAEQVEDEVSEAWRDWMRQRIAIVIEAGHKPALIGEWPEGVPTLASGDPINFAQSDLIDAALIEIERRYELAFPEPEPDKAPVDGWVSQSLAAIAEGHEITSEEIAEIMGLASALPKGQVTSLKRYLDATTEAGHTVRLTGASGKPTLRRALITRALIEAAKYDTPYLTEALRHISAEEPGSPLGLALGTLSITEAEALLDIFEAYDSGRLTLEVIGGQPLLQGDVAAVIAN